MSDRLVAVVQASPSSGSSSAPLGLDPNNVTPGIEGFLVILVLALVTVVLIRSMVARIRRIRYRAERSGEVAESPVLPQAQPSPLPVRPRRRPRQLGPGPAGAIRDVPEQGRQNDSHHLQ